MSLALTCRFCNSLYLFCASIGLPTISNIEVSRQTCLAVSGRISWTTSSTSSPVSYNVTLRSGDDEVMGNTTNTFFEFTGLMPGRSYTTTIVSVSDIGIGFPSMSIFYIPTEQDATLSGTCVCNVSSACKCSFLLHVYILYMYIAVYMC